MKVAHIAEILLSRQFGLIPQITMKNWKVNWLLKQRSTT